MYSRSFINYNYYNYNYIITNKRSFKVIFKTLFNSIVSCNIIFLRYICVCVCACVRACVRACSCYIILRVWVGGWHVSLVVHGRYTRGKQWVLICGVNAPHPFPPFNPSLFYHTSATRLRPDRVYAPPWTRDTRANFAYTRPDGRIQLRLSPFRRAPLLARAVSDPIARFRGRSPPKHPSSSLPLGRGLALHPLGGSGPERRGESWLDSG